MFKVFSVRNLEYDTKLSPQEVTKRLEEATEKSWNLLGSDKSFHGELDNNHFRLIYIAAQTRSFKPLAIGHIVPTRVNSIITVHIKFDSLLVSFMLFFLGGMLYTSALCVFAFLKILYETQTLHPILLLAFGIWGFLFLLNTFSAFYIDSCQDTLSRLFEVEPKVLKPTWFWFKY